MGTPHTHCLIATRGHDLTGDEIHSDDIDDQKRLLAFVDKYSTAVLLHREEDDFDELPTGAVERRETLLTEQTPEYRPAIDHLSDKSDPRRWLFKSDGYSFGVNDDGTAIDSRIRKQYRRIQLYSQMHRCQKSCFKNNRGRKCRYFYPRNDPRMSPKFCVIIRDTDKRTGKRRVRAHPKRNNYYVNTMPRSPLMVCAAGGNTDLQCIMDSRGAAEYATSYATKPDAPEVEKVLNAMAKFYAYKASTNSIVSLQDQYKSVGRALISSQTVSSAQAVWMLLNLPLSQMSRSVEAVNGLPFKQVVSLSKSVHGAKQISTVFPFLNYLLS